MKVVMIGTGYVGLVTGACLAQFGHSVTCVDKDQGKIETLKAGGIPIYEPGLKELVRNNVRVNRLAFTDTLAECTGDADAVFIAVGTPPHPVDGSADMKYVDAAAAEIADQLAGYTVVVTKSTVPVGTGARVRSIIAARLAETGRTADFDMASNPEFLREGSAIQDFMHPDRVVIGVDSERAGKQLSDLYAPVAGETVVMTTEIQTAELIKYAANAFLATKITYINEIADMCENLGANVQDVARGIGLDDRIGGKFLNAGPGYGGSCFPKDSLALVGTADQLKLPLSIVRAVVSANDSRKKSLANRVAQAVGGDLSGKCVAILGLTFKPNTDDMRESPSLTLVPALVAAGVRLKAYDPQGTNEAQKLMPDLAYCASAEEAMQGADVAVIVTEWDEFRDMDLAQAKGWLARPVIVDFRNIYQPVDMAALGFAYYSIGRPPVLAAD